MLATYTTPVSHRFHTSFRISGIVSGGVASVLLCWIYVILQALYGEGGVERDQILCGLFFAFASLLVTARPVARGPAINTIPSFHFIFAG